MDDATGLAEALLGLDGFRVLAVEETPSEVIVTVEKQGGEYVGERNSLITKCPSKYKETPASEKQSS